MSASDSGGSDGMSIDTSLFARVTRVDRLAEQIGTLMAALTTSELGYRLLENPEGYFLAVMLNAIVGWLQGFANRIASDLDSLLTLLADVFVGGLDDAFGPPGRIFAEGVLGLLDGVNEFAVGLAVSSGPFGFVLVPIVWALVTVSVVTGIIGAWRAYKWLRTVVA